MRSVLDGYLTEGCKTCSMWSDGHDGRPLGCNTNVPIDWCPHFKKLMEEDEKKRRDLSGA